MARSRRIFPGGADVRIEIPIDPNRKGDLAERTRRATLWLISRGVYPTPSAVNMRMRGRTRDCLNGVETKARNAVLLERGLGRMRRLSRTYALILGEETP